METFCWSFRLSYIVSQLYISFISNIICCSTFQKYTNEAFVKETQKQSTDYELSVFKKLLRVDKHIAFVMTLELLMAGVDTVSKNKFFKLLDWGYFFYENSANVSEEFSSFLKAKIQI